METRVRFMWKARESITGNCPALYEADGGYVVQGKILGPGTTASLRDLGTDETAVWVPANVIDRIKGS